MLTSSTFQACYQLKSLLEKFRVLHAAAFLPQPCKRSHAFILRLAAGREERAHSGRTQKTVIFQRVAKPDQERNGINGGPHEVGRRPFMPDSTLSRRSAALLRVDLGDRCSIRGMNFTRKLQKTQIKAFPKSKRQQKTESAVVAK